MENKHLNEALNEAGELIKNKFKVAASNDGFKATGRLQESFDYSIVANRLQVKAEKYAGALSEGIKKKGKYSREMSGKLIKWAKAKGLRPQFRDKKGRFQKVTNRSWRNLGFVLARSIAGESNARNPKNPKGGISKRFGYKGSGFMQEVKNSMEKKITSIIEEGYKKDLEVQLSKINKNR